MHPRRAAWEADRDAKDEGGGPGALLAAGCGGGAPGPDTSPSSPSGFRRATISSPGPTIEVDAGRPITVGLRNIHGYPDGEFIPHDWAVVARKEEGSEPLWGSQIPFIDPDEAGIVTFTPGEPGRYFSICTLSSHLSGHGMWGRIVVR